MMDEKYLIIVNAIVEDEADINATDKSRWSEYSALINKADEGDIDAANEEEEQNDSAVRRKDNEGAKKNT